MTSDGFPPIGEIVPHGEAMVLLDELAVGRTRLALTTTFHF